MTYLIALVLAIALTAVVIFSFNSSLNERQFLVEQKKAEILTVITSINSSLRERETYDSGFLNRENWQETLQSNFDKPYFLQGFTVYFDDYGDGFFSCLMKEGENDTDIHYVAAKAIEYTSSIVKVENDCGGSESGLAIYIRRGIF